jgi:hypothetical protein
MITKVAPILLSVIGILVFGSGNAGATECDDIFPGAQRGPPHEWTFWGDGSACFVRWISKDANDQERLLAQCRNTAGARFVDFELDKETGVGICLFKILDIKRPLIPGASDPVKPALDDRNTAEQLPGLDRVRPAAKAKTQAKAPAVDKKPIAKLRKKVVATTKKNMIRVRPTSIQIEQRSAPPQSAGRKEQSESRRTKLRVNGTPFLLKPASSQCFLSVHLCKPK